MNAKLKARHDGSSCCVCDNDAKRQWDVRVSRKMEFCVSFAVRFGKYGNKGILATQPLNKDPLRVM